MGSWTTLTFNQYELMSSSNHLFTYDGMGLFLPEDKKTIPYKNTNNHKENHPAYVRKLSSMVERLELMGYTLNRAEKEIKACIHPDITLKEFFKILSHIDLNSKKTSDLEDLFKPTKDTIRFENIGLSGYILASPKAVSLLNKYRYEDDYLENWPYLDPLLELRCLAEVGEYSNDNVIWEYYDLVVGGWINESDINVTGVSPSYLILTEGKTDTEIIQKSLNTFHPNIRDFFFFADTENHPFGGTNDIAKFVKGLIDIKYGENLIVILDNDLEGNKAFDKIKSYTLPKNFSVHVLPELEEFNDIETVGTNGLTKMNINGQAVSIECFLDLNLDNEKPIIRWTHWDEKIGKYQGSFEQKIKNKLKSKFDGAYNNNFAFYETQKLKKLTNFIVQKAKDIND